MGLCLCPCHCPCPCQKIATTLADLNADGLSAQAVNDRLTVCVGAASQHVLRMSFVPDQEAYNFDGQVRHPLQCSTTTQSPTSTTLNHTLTTKEQTALLLKPLGAALRLKTTQKKQVSTIQRNLHKQIFDSLAETPVERSVHLTHWCAPHTAQQ